MFDRFTDVWPRCAGFLAACVTAALALAWRAESPEWVLEALAAGGAILWLNSEE